MFLITASAVFEAKSPSGRKGTYTGHSSLDTDFRGQTDINIEVKVTVLGGEIEVDFTGSHPQTQGLINSVPGNTLSYVYMAFTALCPEIPVNSGFFRPIKTILPEGSVVNPCSPAPAGLATICIGADIGEAMIQALSKFAPEKAGTISLDLCIFGAWGVDPRYQSFFVTYDYNGSPVSARAAFGTDGWGGWASTVSAVQMESMEQMETKYHSFICRANMRKIRQLRADGAELLHITCSALPMVCNLR